MSAQQPISTVRDAQWDHDQIIVNDVRLHYVEAGPEDGPTVILLHGFPEFWYSWRHQIPGLAAAGYHVIAPDMRGYNRSEKPHGTEAYHIDHLTADIAGLVEHVSDGSAHIVGHDWGGAVAWATAMDHPSVVDRLVILNAPHPAKFARELSLEQAKRSWYIYLFQLPRLPEWLFSMREYRTLEEMFTETATDGAFTDEDIARYKTAFRQPGSLTSAVNYYRNLLSPEQATDILANIPLIGDRLAGPVPQISAPTLVLWGEDDTALTVEQSEGLERYVTDVRVERFPEATHWIQLDIPEQVLEELTAFLGPDN